MAEVNIIYLLPEMKGASGGAKVIYNHSSILNNLNKNISSKVIYLKKNFLYKLQLSLSKRIKFFDKKSSGWDGKKMQVKSEGAMETRSFRSSKRAPSSSVWLWLTTPTSLLASLIQT